MPIPENYHRNRRQAKRATAKQRKPPSITERVNSRPTRERQEGAAQAPNDNDARKGRRREQTECIHDVCRERQEREQQSEAHHADREEHHRQREAHLGYPAVGHDGKWKGERSDDGERESVFWLAFVAVSVLELDVDFVEVLLAQDDGKDRSDA